MRVFITGIAGFLGSHLADALLQAGHEVSGTDNLLGGYSDNVPAGVQFHSFDCNNLKVMTAITKGVDIVYHCAAAPYEGLSVFSPHFVTQNIVTSTTSVITAAIRNKVKRFILLSSMSRYGTNTVPFTEDMTPAPQDPYGIGKWTSELMLANLATTHGMEYAIAVPHNIIGIRQKYDDPYRNVASIFINLMLQGRQPMVYGDGNQMRCFSFVDDVVQPLLRMIDCPSGEVINLGPDTESLTINDLAHRIADLLGFDLRIQHIPARPQEVLLATCSAAKARRLLGYEAVVKLDSGLQQMIGYIRARGVRPFTYHLPLEIVSDLTPETWSRRLF